MNQSANFVQAMRSALTQDYMVEFRQRLEVFEQLLEMHDNSKVSTKINILSPGDQTVYKWLKSYVHGGSMIPNHIATMSMAIDYIERLDENACYICHEAMTMEYESAENFITGCTNCHMPICSACVITAARATGKCSACNVNIGNVWLSADHYSLIKGHADDFISIGESQLAERNHDYGHNADDHDDHHADDHADDHDDHADDHADDHDDHADDHDDHWRNDE